MNRRVILGLLVPLTVVGLTLLGACATRGSRQPMDGLAVATADSAAAHLARLELRRVADQAAGLAETPSGRELDARIAVLWDQLRELPDRAAAERTAVRHVLQALDARQAGLAVDRRQLLVTFTEESPQVQHARAEERLLERRRTELRTMLSDDRRIGSSLR